MSWANCRGSAPPQGGSGQAAGASIPGRARRLLTAAFEAARRPSPATCAAAPRGCRTHSHDVPYLRARRSSSSTALPSCPVCGMTVARLACSSRPPATVDLHVEPFVERNAVASCLWSQWHRNAALPWSHAVLEATRAPGQGQRLRAAQRRCARQRLRRPTRTRSPNAMAEWPGGLGSIRYCAACVTTQRPS